MKVTVENLVPTIRSLSDKFEHFHLSTCVCGAPMWQQPCTLCGYYPYWGATVKQNQKHAEARHNKTSRETFCRMVRAWGNILEFYMRSFHHCMDPQMDKLHAARRVARWLSIEWPTPEEIWDHFTREDIDLYGLPNKER